MKYVRNKKIPIAIQCYNLKSEFPDMKISLLRNKLKCWFTVTPTKLSKTYNIYITYNGNKRPKVVLYGKSILKIDDPNFPHIYDKNVKENKVDLCLYYAREWNKTKLISETIIPWIVEWLVHYEIWLVTGKWNGGGKHPSLENRRDNK